ncbi:MAG: hypothetical protein KBA26_10995 [Candidatus Delongbacteria bacterium]|nr:hypothetical protein [Candidatus Delongbacteria bacterium]
MNDFNLIVMGLFPGLSILVLGLAGWMVYQQYRSSTFSGPAQWRRYLLLLRWSAWLLLGLLLFQPIIQFSKKYHEKPIDYLVLDNSLSLSLNRGFSKSDLNEAIRKWLGDYATLDHEKHLLLFGDQIKPVEFWSDFNQADYQAKTTRLVPVLEYIMQHYPDQNINNLILFSDGYLQDQSQAAQMLPDLPFRTVLVGIGDTVGNPDLKISYVTHDPIAYLGEETKISVTIGSIATGTIPVRLQINEEQTGKPLAEQTLNLPESGRQIEIPFTIRPNKLGKHFYTAHIRSSLPEVITQNNQFSFMVNVLKSKLRILTVWGIPDYDYKFLHLALTSERNFLPEFWVLSHPDARSGVERAFQTLENYDLIILGHLQAADLNASQWNRLAGAMKDRHQPLVIFSGTGTRSISSWSSTALESLVARLKPLVISDQYRAPLQWIPDPVQSVNTFLDVKGTTHDNLKYWSSMAPLNQAVLLRDNPAGVQVLASLGSMDQNEGSRFPGVWLDRRQWHKALVFAATPIWRHDFASLESFDGDRSARQVWIDMVKFMVFLEDQNQLMINPIRAVFQDGDEVIFEGKAWGYSDESGRQDRYELIIADSSAHEIQSLKFSESESSGRLSATAGRLRPGRYSYQITQYREDQPINQKKDAFIVTDYNSESAQVGQNLHFLREMDHHSMIHYVNLNDSSRLILDSLSHHPRDMGVKKEISIWDNIWILLVMIMIWGCEWFIRQRNLML